MKTILQTTTLENRVCCITGGARGIGAALVKHFNDAGFRVIFTYRHDASDNNAKVLEIQGRIVAIKCDSSTIKGADTLLAGALKVYGRADILINNAGSELYGLIQDTSEDEYIRCINDNLTSVFVGCKAFAQHFISKGYGRIINISSIWGEKGGSGESVYSAAKSGVIGFTKALAKELAPSGVTVNCISPGVINTDMIKKFNSSEIADIIKEIPLMRLGMPEDIAAAAVYLANAEYITGQILGVNGGMS